MSRSSSPTSTKPKAPLEELAGKAFRADTLLVIPTHSHPETLPLAIASAQNQTEQNLGIVVIGDGVSDDTRDALAPILKSDERVSFVDRPKTVRHGEEYRDEVIRASRATAIGYLCDDDLLFPDHIQTLAGLLEGVDFVNTLPIFINRDGSLHHMVCDLADPASVKWHLDPAVMRNTVSLTGVLHSRAAYKALPHGWRPAPKGRWTDHYMWEQFFSAPNFTARTSPRATTAKFNQIGREDMTGAERARELDDFARKMSAPGFSEMWDARVRDSERQTLVRLALDNTVLQDNCASALQHGERLSRDLEAAHRQSEALQSSLDRMLTSRSWTVTVPLRKLRASLRRKG